MPTNISQSNDFNRLTSVAYYSTLLILMDQMRICIDAFGLLAVIMK